MLGILPGLIEETIELESLIERTTIRVKNQRGQIKDIMIENQITQHLTFNGSEASFVGEKLILKPPAIKKFQ